MPADWKGEFQKLWRLSLPVILSQVGNMSMNLVDTWVLGQHSSAALAGVSAGNSIFFPILIVSMGLSLGIDPLVSLFQSSGKTKQVEAVFSQSMIFVLGLSILVTPIIFFSSQILNLIGTNPEVLHHAEPYLQAMSFSLPFILIFNTFQRYWQAMEIATPITVIVLLANIVNLLLDLALVDGWKFIPALGAEGVGWATVGCRFFQCLAVAYLSLTIVRTKGLPFPRLGQILKLESSIMSRLLKLSLPAASQIGLEVLAFNVVTMFVSRIGAIELASHQIILSLASFSFMFPMGIANATAVRVGINLGKQQPGHARLAGNLGILSGVICMSVFALLFLLIPNFLLTLFTSDTEVIGIALGITGLCALFQIADGVQVVAAGALRGLGDTKSALYSNIFGFYFVGLPLALALYMKFEMDLLGLWIGLALSLTLIALINLLVWLKSSIVTAK